MSGMWNVIFCVALTIYNGVCGLQYTEKQDSDLGHIRRTNGDLEWADPPEGSYHGNNKDSNAAAWISTINFAKAIIKSSSQPFPYELLRRIIKDDYDQAEIDEYESNIEVSCGLGGLFIAVIVASFGGYFLYTLYTRRRRKYTGQKPLFYGKKLNILMVIVGLTTLVQFIFVICIMEVNSNINTGIDDLDNRVEVAMNETTSYFQQTKKQFSLLTTESNKWYFDAVIKNDFENLGGLLWQPGHQSFYPTILPVFKSLEGIGRYITNSKESLTSLHHQIQDITKGLGAIVKSNLSTAFINLTVIRGDWTCMGCDGSCSGCKNIDPDGIFPHAGFFSLPDLNNSVSGLQELTKEPFESSLRNPKNYFQDGLASVIHQTLQDNITDLLDKLTNVMAVVEMSTKPLKFPDEKNLYFDKLLPQFKDFHQRVEHGNNIRSGFTWFFTTINILGMVVTVGVLIFILSQHYNHCRTLMVSQEDKFTLPRRILLGCCIGCIVLCVSYLGLAIGGFYIGANLERVACQPNQDYTIVEEVVDFPGAIPDHPGYFMGSVVLGNGSYKLTFSEILRKCKDNLPAYTAFRMNQAVPHLLQDLNISQQLLNTADMFDSMYIDLVQTSLVPPQLEPWLDMFNKSTTFNTEPFLDLFNKSVVRDDLDLYIQNLKRIANTPEADGGPIKPSKGRLIELADYLTLIKPNIIRLQNRKIYLEETYNAFQSNTSSVLDKLINAIALLSDMNDQFRNQSSELIKMGVDEYRTDFKSTVADFSKITHQWIYNDIGLCQPITDAYDSIVYGFCDKVADFENAEWLLNGINAMLLLLLSVLLLLVIKSLIVDTTHHDDINTNFEKIFGKKRGNTNESFMDKALKKIKESKPGSLRGSYNFHNRRKSSVTPLTVLTLQDLDQQNTDA